MNCIADLHIHSRYSMATSPLATPEYLALWAEKKGISIVGTGDLTHPGWRAELREKLSPAEDGFYRLKEEFSCPEAAEYPGEEPRFLLSGEISSIYKKNGKTRKVHNVILLPDLESADRFSARLEAVGNIRSDGRPILRLDCRELLGILLETCPRGILIPAHVWTPHFSLFGAFSGFDSIEECFGDLTPCVHALETGLSSDPAMNRRWSALDGYRLVSNSDAHSPAKLGREANLLDIPFSYQGLYDAVQYGKGLLGTLEFFPEEGKYYHDGHRKCGLCLSPEETESCHGICPVCGKKITLGVSSRIRALSDRKPGCPEEKREYYERLVPLLEMIAACEGLSAAGRKAQAKYEEMLKRAGTEFDILRKVPLEEIRAAGGEKLEEGIRRLREGKVSCTPGFDGEYGKIKLTEES